MVKIHRNTIIISVAALAFFIMLLQFVYLPKQKDIGQLKDVLEKSRERNLRIRELAKNPDFFANLAERVVNYHQEVQSLLPKKIKLSGLLRELSILAKKNKVDVLSIRPIEGAEQTVETVSASDGSLEEFLSSLIEINVQCGYEDIGRYIEAIENNNLTVMAFNYILIELDEENPDPSQLKITLTIDANYQSE